MLSLGGHSNRGKYGSLFQPLHLTHADCCTTIAHVCAVGTDTVYSRVGNSRHAETLKKLTGDISQPSTELGFHDVTDEWKGWVLAGPDDDDADDE